MGRIFEKRKHKIFARNAALSKAFTKIGREIAMAVKQGGPDPNNNPRLRAAMNNAKAAAMPKDKVEAAVKRAAGKEEGNFEEIVYEGYGPHGVAILMETATDNPTRTVANIRMYLNRAGGSLGTTGSVAFMFEHKSFFRVEDKGYDLEELELELIDFGLEDLARDEDGIHIYTGFTDFGAMMKHLEEKGMTIIESTKPWISNAGVELTEEQEQAVMDLLEKLEEDDDILDVYHTLK